MTNATPPEHPQSGAQPASEVPSPGTSHGPLEMMHEWIQLAPQGMALIQFPQGTVIDVNPILSELMGWPLQQMLGLTTRELGIWVEPGQRDEILERTRASPQPSSFELQVRRQCGGIVDVQIWIRSTRLNDQEYLIVTVADQTQAKRTAAALRASQKKFALAFELMPDAMTISEMATGKLIEVNASFERQFGWTSAEAVGQTTAELNLWVDANDRQRLLESLQHKMPRAIEAWGRARDGAIRLYQLMAETFTLDSTPILIITLRDIHQQREQELKLKDSEERLNQAMQSADLGYWDVQFNPLTFFASARGASLHGLAEQPMHGHMKAYMQHVVPADRLRIEQHFKDYASGKISELQMVYGVQMPDGSLRHVESSSRLYPNPNNQQHRVTGILRDVSERIQYEEKLRASEEKFTTLFQGSMEACCVTRPEDGAFLEINQTFSETFGWTAEEIIGKPHSALDFWVHPEQREIIKQAMLTDGFIRNYPLQFRHKQGQVLHCLTSVKLLHLGSESVLTSSIQDITAQLEAEAALKISQDKFAKAFHSSPDSISITDLSTTRYLEVNEGFTRISGYSAREVLGHSYLDIGLWSTPEERARMQEILKRDGRIRNEEVQARRKNGSHLYLSVSMEPFELDGAPCMLTTCRDITDLKAAEDRIEHMAYHDPLTNLPNRSLLTDRLTQQISLLKRHHLRGALMFMDLDHFKTINDSLGHAAGDAVLKMVTARLESVVRGEDTVARLGGDEFVVLLSALEGDLSSASQQALALAEKLRALLAEPMLYDGYQLHVTPSIGIALIPDDGEHPSDLLKHADIALYRAKDAGRNAIKLFRKDMLEHANERLRLENDLRQALTAGQFELHYQPQVDTRSGRIIGAEALLRWEHPTLGRQSPAQFIRVLEESGQIVAVGQWVLAEACRACALLLHKQWVDPQQFCMAVNISARQFAQSGFVDSIFATLSEHGVPPRMLKLEVTESIVIKDLESTIAKMQQLKQGGVNFAMDDFGTGYSSLTYLKRLPVDVLKIDQSFIRDATRDPNDAQIIRAIVAMANSLKLETIAEGVEYQEQLDFLIEEGCHAYQGYLFSPPVTFDAVCERLARNR